VSLEDDVKLEWQEEFEQNYYCPKLILIGTSASDEVKISANLAGVEIRTLSGLEKLTVDFGEVYEIGQKIQSWNDFLKSGNRVLHERSTWVDKIFNMLKEVVDSFGNDEITMPKKLYETSKKDAWIVNEKNPFINIPIWYKDISICGIYEYFDDKLAFSETKVYVDFNIDAIGREENKELILQIEELVKKLLLDKGYEVICFEHGCATITLERELLENNNSFKEKYIQVISDAMYLHNEIENIFGKNE